jgi:hypothetical protein
MHALYFGQGMAGEQGAVLVTRLSLFSGTVCLKEALRSLGDPCPIASGGQRSFSGA